ANRAGQRGGALGRAGITLPPPCRPGKGRADHPPVFSLWENAAEIEHSAPAPLPRVSAEALPLRPKCSRDRVCHAREGRAGACDTSAKGFGETCRHRKLEPCCSGFYR